jgi:hypothetical protein
MIQEIAQLSRLSVENLRVELESISHSLNTVEENVYKER